MNPSRKMLVLGLVAATCALIAAPAAQGSTSCGYTSYSQPFSPWDDANDYVMVKSGNFELGGSGWKFGNGAKVLTTGNSLLPGSGLKSVYLPPGSYALSPPICIEEDFPSARMFATTTISDELSTDTLRVDAVYKDSYLRKTLTQPAAVVSDAMDWAPTAPLILPYADRILPDKLGKLWVQYKFVPLYRSAWRIDDIYADPKRR